MSDVVAGFVEAATPSLRNRAIRGVAWSLTSYAGSQIIRLGSSLVLTRLLFPEAFGLMALVWSYLTGLTMFSDLGLVAYLFQSPRAQDQDFHDAIWSVGIVRGCFFVLAAALLAFPMARLYGQPVLVPMLLVASAGQCMTTFNATKLTTARRELRQKELAVYGLIMQAITVMSTIVLAWWLRSVWAMVWGGVIGAICQAVGSQFFFPGPRNRWRWDREVVRDLWGFSTWIYISSAMTFFGSQADRLVLGKLAPLEFLGLYGIAMNFATLPLALIQQGSGLISPIVVQLRHSQDLAIERKLQEARSLLLQAGAVSVAMMGVSAPAFYGILYDARYAKAGALCAVLAIGIWTSMAESSVSGVVLAFGDAKGAAICSAGRMLGTVVGAFSGYLLAGIYGLMIGLSVGPLIVYILSILLIRKHRIHLGWGDIQYWVLLMGLAAVGWVGILAARLAKPSISPTAASLVGTLFVALTSVVYLRKTAMYLVSLGVERLKALKEKTGGAADW